MTDAIIAKPPRYPLLLQDPKVLEWLDQGRGVAVWKSVEIGVDRPDVLTPADGDLRARKPHWAYTVAPEEILTCRGQVRIYRKSSVVASWSDTPAGWKAAQRALGTGVALDKEWEAPGGWFAVTHTIERFELKGPDRGDGVLLAHEFRVGIVAWFARIDDEKTHAA